MSSDLAAADEYGDVGRGRGWPSSRQSTLRTPNFSPYNESPFSDHPYPLPESPLTRGRTNTDEFLSSSSEQQDDRVTLTLVRQQDATLRLLAAYRAHAANLEVRLSAPGNARPSSLLSRLMEDEDRLRSNSLRLLEQDLPARTRAGTRLELADLAAVQRKEALALRTGASSSSSLSSPLGGSTLRSPNGALEREKEAERERELEQLRQENTRLRSALREETLSLQTRLRELGRAGALLAGAPQPTTADNEVMQILETDLWNTVNARLQSIIDRRLREEQLRTADLVAEQRQLKSDNERLRRDLDAAAVLIRKLQTEDLKDYAQLREQHEVDRRVIEELKTAKEAMGVEHDKVAEVCRGLQQLLDSTNALLKRAVGELDGTVQRADEATVLRVKAEEVLEVARREVDALRASLGAAEAALRQAQERQRESDEKISTMETALKELPLLRASLAAAETAKRETEEKAAAELAAGAQRLQEERQRAAVEARALQAKVAFLSHAESAIKESISEVRNTCNVLHTLLARPDTIVSAN